MHRNNVQYDLWWIGQDNQTCMCKVRASRVKVNTIHMSEKVEQFSADLERKWNGVSSRNALHNSVIRNSTVARLISHRAVHARSKYIIEHLCVGRWKNSRDLAQFTTDESKRAVRGLPIISFILSLRFVTAYTPFRRLSCTLRARPELQQANLIGLL